MSRAKHFEQYGDIPEVVPGVFVDPGQMVYIVDARGEVVSWGEDEWADDTYSVTAAVTAVAIAALDGASMVRLNIARSGEVLRSFIGLTAERLQDAVPLHDEHWRAIKTLLQMMHLWRQSINEVGLNIWHKHDVRQAYQDMANAYRTNGLIDDYDISQERVKVSGRWLSFADLPDRYRVQFVPTGETRKD